jgi:NADPH:quinone reductase
MFEVMFTRSLFKTYDMVEQHHLLNTVTNLIDNKRIKTTITDLFTPINAENLRKAHKKVESGNTIVEIVLSGF